MGPDDLVCYCYRVPLRKLVNYARREKPSRASQMSQCLDAGTGCGWCIPILKRIHENADRFDAAAIDPEQYEAERSAYRTDPNNRNQF
ncbi:MAG: bacterioferritin-associated ferredoxin [Planctomycetota bacterium]|jgi:NAD(P)H-nitrite reductase large subunit